MLFQEQLKVACRSRRVCFNWAVDEEVNPYSLMQPTIHVANPLFQKGLIELTLGVADEADETERSGHTRLQR
jgi:hypothetical protein